jgi:hypothetical protein
MKRYLPALFAFAVIVLSGALHGMWTDRWALSPELKIAVARLNNVPKTIGGWKSKDAEVDAEQIAQANIAAYLARVYEHPKKGKFMVFLMCGRPGPISVHTPDICYPALGFQEVGKTAKHAVKYGSAEQKAEFVSALFRRSQSTGAEDIRIYWSWNAIGSWRAPSDPRFAFGAKRALYKMYVVQTGLKSNVPSEPESANDFLTVVLPKLQKSLFPSS